MIKKVKVLCMYTCICVHSSFSQKKMFNLKKYQDKKKSKLNFVCIYVCVYACMCICVHVCMYVYTDMHVCICVCVHVCMFACLYVYMCVCMCICVCDTWTLTKAESDRRWKKHGAGDTDKEQLLAGF